jgi:hypothetical protein
MKAAMPKMLELQRKWREIETAKIGSSPTGEIDLSLPSQDKKAAARIYYSRQSENANG